MGFGILEDKKTKLVEPVFQLCSQGLVFLTGAFQIGFFRSFSNVFISISIFTMDA